MAHGGLSRLTRGLMMAGLVGAPAGLFAEDIKYQPVDAAAPAIILSGYVDTSIMARFGEASSSHGTAGFPNTLRSPGRLYDDPAKNDGFNLNAASLAFDKPLDDSRWASGFHAQVLMGPDAALRNLYSLAGNPTDIGLNEAYGVLRAPLGNGLETRIGYFSSPLGYEVYDSARNPNYSRSYGFYLEPKSHTGVTLNYSLTEWLGLMAGVANNYSPFLNARSVDPWDDAYLALLTLNGAWFGQPDAQLKLGYTGGHTATSAPTDTGPRIHNFYAGAHLPLPVKGLTLGLTYDYQANYAAGVPAVFFFPAGPGESYANATGLYLNYAVARWQFNTRAEYASATAGNTILVNYDPFGSNKPMFGAHDDKFFGLTETVDYRLWRNVVSRIEFRWDRDLTGGVPAFGSAANPRKDSFTLALNLIYLF